MVQAVYWALQHSASLGSYGAHCLMHILEHDCWQAYTLPQNADAVLCVALDFVWCCTLHAACIAATVLLNALRAVLPNRVGIMQDV